MKKILILLFMNCTILVYSQNRFSFGALHNYGLMFPKSSTYDFKPNFKNSFVGFGISSKIKYIEDSYFQFDLQGSLLIDDFTQSINENFYFVNKKDAYNFSFGLNVGRKVSKYLGLSSGLRADFYSCELNTINESLFNSEKLFSSSLVFPINLDLYLPIKTKNFILSNSLMIRKSNLYLQTMLKFEI